MDFTAIDFETANQYRTSACSLGLAVVRNNRIVEQKEWLIRPEPFEFSPFNTAVHGITADDVKSAPTFKEIWREVSPYIENQIVVAHNASFDTSVLKNSLEYFQIAIPNCEILCTYRISQVLYPNAGAHRLNVICELLGIPLNHHEASSDAAASAEILLRIIAENDLKNISALKKFCGITPGYFEDGGQRYKPCRKRSSYEFGDKDNPLKDTTAVWIDEDFKDKAFVFTGSLLSMPRQKAKEVVTRGGGIMHSTVRKDTDYLVVGIQDFTKLNGHTESSKMRRAYELQEKGSPLRIIGEDEFVNMIDDELYSLCFLTAKPS